MDKIQSPPSYATWGCASSVSKHDEPGIEGVALPLIGKHDDGTALPQTGKPPSTQCWKMRRQEVWRDVEKTAMPSINQSTTSACIPAPLRIRNQGSFKETVESLRVDKIQPPPSYATWGCASSVSKYDEPGIGLPLIGNHDDGTALPQTGKPPPTQAISHGRQMRRQEVWRDVEKTAIPSINQSTTGVCIPAPLRIRNQGSFRMCDSIPSDESQMRGSKFFPPLVPKLELRSTFNSIETEMETLRTDRDGRQSRRSHGKMTHNHIPHVGRRHRS